MSAGSPETRDALRETTAPSRLTREERGLALLAVILLSWLTYSWVVVRAHRPLRPGEPRAWLSTDLLDRHAAWMFAKRGQDPREIHVSTMICHGNSRFWAVRQADHGSRPEPDPRPRPASSAHAP